MTRGLLSSMSVGLLAMLPMVPQLSNAVLSAHALAALLAYNEQYGQHPRPMCLPLQSVMLSIIMGNGSASLYCTVLHSVPLLPSHVGYVPIRGPCLLHSDAAMMDFLHAEYCHLSYVCRQSPKMVGYCLWRQQRVQPSSDRACFRMCLMCLLCL